MIRRRMVRAALVAGGVLASVLLQSPASVSAHPLGNFTVNRAVLLEIHPEALDVRYVIDMAEIPAFAEMRTIDADGGGSVAAAERDAYGSDACGEVWAAFSIRIDGAAVEAVEAGPPELTFPAGAGGLNTVRLVCSLEAAVRLADGEQRIDVADATEDGRLGWREVVIAAAPGVEILGADVPALSPSAGLTTYPEDQLASPPDVRSGSATARISSGARGAGDAAPASLTSGPAPDGLAALVSGTALGSGILAPLVALLLGAAHAVSPGHGKTLVAAYVVGSPGTLRRAAVLGVTVAVTHTLGVFVVGGVLLLGGEFLVPDQVVIWLSVVAGVLVLAFGIGMLVRALRETRHARAHDHGHAHQHEHNHGHPGADGSVRNVVAIGLAGGMVPSASAVIVLLVAIGTNQVAYGLGLIVAFGAGMALVLGGLALTVGWLRGRVAGTASPLLRRAGRVVPFVAAVAVLLAGLATFIGAIAQIA